MEEEKITKPNRGDCEDPKCIKVRERLESLYDRFNDIELNPEHCAQCDNAYYIIEAIKKEAEDGDEMFDLYDSWDAMLDENLKMIANMRGLSGRIRDAAVDSGDDALRKTLESIANDIDLSHKELIGG